MKKRKTILRILSVLLVLIIAVAIFGFEEFNRKPKDLTGLKPTVTVSAVDFIKDFSKDDKAAEGKYIDKVVEVKGIVKEAKKDEKGFYTIVLGDTSAMSSVRCSMDGDHSDAFKNLSRGNNLSVKGICTGYNADEFLGSDVILNRAVINNNN